MSDKYKAKYLPSVDKILEDDRISGMINPLNRGAVTGIIREVISGYRESLLREELEVDQRAELKELVIRGTLEELNSISGIGQSRVINATGVILHTNLGRSILSDEIRSSIEGAVSGYVDLEMEISTGRRTSRDRRAARLLKLLTGAGDALLVNNNAAAVMVAVNTFAGGGAVAVSRGEMVEIGGSFRLPEILDASAAGIIEVGTTNRTHPEDYIEAIRNGATMLLKVHASNYQVVGYTTEVSLRELSRIGREHDVPVMYDQGSGVIYPFAREGIMGEETVQEILSTGVDLISFSTDKVMGSVQGGVVLGRPDLVGRIRANHLSRAVRVDKITVAAMERCLLHYWKGEFDCIPTFAMMTEGAESVKKRAEAFSARIKKILPDHCEVKVEWGESSIGGGSFPIKPLRTALIAINLPTGQADRLEAELRSGEPAVFVRVKDKRIYLDLRTVSEEEERVLKRELERAVKKISERK